MTPLPGLRIGAHDIIAMSDGILKTSLDFVGGVERATASDLVGGASEVFVPVNNFLIDVGGRRVLIDAGSGSNMQPTLGKLPENLRAAGFDPASITHVLLTHLHPDHANGLIDDAGQPHFPNAELVLHGTEAAFWLRPADGPEREPVARNRRQSAANVAPYRDRMRLVRDNEDVFGFTPFLAAGHTPGHSCWRFGAGNEAILFWGDIVHLSAVQITHPQAWMTYDLDRDQAEQSRRRILDMAASEAILVAGAHIASPGLGHVVRHQSGFAFEPAG